MSSQENEKTPAEPFVATEGQGDVQAATAEQDAGRKVDVFEAKCHPITAERLPLLHELTVGVYWPHRARDLELLTQIGEGYLALDEVGRALGSSMKFEYGSDFAMIGMMTTAPRLQSKGTGRWLLNKIMDECSGRDMRLTATRAGYRLYEQSGFIPVAPVRQQQGIARRIYLPEGAEGLTVRLAEDGDWQGILDLDQHAFGADRSHALACLQAKSECFVAEQAGRLTGFAMVRNFGKGQVIGPVVAENDQMAIQVVAPIIQSREGKFLRLDTPAAEGEFSAFLSAAGLGVYDTVTEMRIGPNRRADTGAVLYGLAAHTLG
ncbi:GNAT family N-acetyltransferase [Tropicibacter sp. R15_0]|uniref:GNAT family N-acetyltransferase n=1 Tax=Tropicibacter sp. R15_0 TaxID=2821101 RepID=UPI001ADADF6C|nr:GNAT family N-acetyltransferase [Tropicibacter sp. R15_0]MBO9467816.1 GNAT family N-acetyltransferase [Tropicibacter sp. R15_0]